MWGTDMTATVTAGEGRFSRSKEQRIPLLGLFAGGGEILG